MSMPEFNNNEIIGILTEAIMHMEQDEIAFYDYLAANTGTIDVAFLKKQIECDLEIIAANTKLFKKISEAKDSGQLRFLDEKPFRIAILRLKAAVSQAQTACDEMVPSPTERHTLPLRGPQAKTH